MKDVNVLILKGKELELAVNYYTKLNIDKHNELEIKVLKDFKLATKLPIYYLDIQTAKKKLLNYNTSEISLYFITGINSLGEDTYTGVFDFYNKMLVNIRDILLIKMPQHVAKVYELSEFKTQIVFNSKEQVYTDELDTFNLKTHTVPKIVFNLKNITDYYMVMYCLYKTLKEFNSDIQIPFEFKDLTFLEPDFCKFCGLGRYVVIPVLERREVDLGGLQIVYSHLIDPTYTKEITYKRLFKVCNHCGQKVTDDKLVSQNNLLFCNSLKEEGLIV